MLKSQMIDKQRIKEMNKLLNHTDNIHLQKLRKLKFSLLFWICRKLYQLILQKLAGNNLVQSYHRRSYIDKRWLIVVLKDYRRSLLLAEGQCKKIPLADDGLLYPIDANIARTVFQLNMLGIETKFSCEGHLKKHIYSSPYILLNYNHRFPQDLMKMLKESGLIFKHKAQKEDEENPYRHGESLYGDAYMKESALSDYAQFWSVLDKWADKYQTPSVDSLKNKWKQQF